MTTSSQSVVQDARRIEIEDRELKRQLQAARDLMAFILRRIGFGVIVLVAIIYMTHFGLDMARGTAYPSALTRAITATFDSILRILTGDLGLSQAATSTLNPIPVAEAFPGMFLRSVGLLGISLLFAAMVGVTLGIFTARRKSQVWPTLTTIISILGVSIPSFLAAIILQRIVITITQNYGVRLLPLGGFGWDLHLILPALVLAARPIAQITRITFVSTREVLGEDYVRTAKSKGLAPIWVMWRHVMRNAAIPIATTIGLSLRFSLSSLPVVEAFFGWSGLGFYLLKGISQQDDNLTVILVLCLGALFIGVNLALDLLYRLLDPRLRNEVDQVSNTSRLNPLEAMRSIAEGIKAIVVDNAIVRNVRTWRISAKGVRDDESLTTLKEQQGPVEEGLPLTSGAKKRTRYLNLSLILGLVLVLGLTIVTLAGDRLAPNSPYTTRGLKIVDGEFLVPPFEPNEEFTWGTDVLGRDIQSLILAGAWQTMRLAGIVVVVRLLVGFVLGAIAGWKSGGWVDRLILSLAETLFAFPPLVFSMILILALGIRKGLGPFIITLSFVGWGEVMHYVRSEVMAMRPKTFIESAVAVGQRVPGIITHHVLPNLVPALISIAALEMGSVLMLLGELGYVGLFIGGGAFVELDIDMAPYHYSDVPEWGALLSNVRLFALSYPWTAFYPAIAFFVAIAGFNLFGEGLRWLVSDEGVRFKRIFNKYTLAVFVLGLAGFTWVRGATGSVSIYARQAQTFDGSAAMENLQALVSPATEGRAIGSVGLDVTAEWIAAEFEKLGLQPAGKSLTYFQPRRRDYQSIDQAPIFLIDDGGPMPVYREDYAAFPAYFRNLGDAMGTVTFVAMGDMSTGPYYMRHPSLESVDYRGEIVMVLSGYEEALLNEVDRSGVLVVSDDPLDLQRNFSFSTRDPHFRPYGIDRVMGHDTPVIWINEEMADRLLEGTGQTVADLRLVREGLIEDEIFELPTGKSVAIEVQGTIHEKVTANIVIGHWPGQAGYPGEMQMDNRLIVVMAKYDNPPIPHTGEPLQGANDNASGVAVMLEMIRAMKESGYDPYRTILFVAYSGEGSEGGTPALRPDVSQILQSKAGFASRLEPEAVLELRGVGAGSREELALVGGGSLRLTNLFEEVSGRVGVPTLRVGGDVDLSVIYRTGSSRESAEETPYMLITWDGWESTAATQNDQIALIDVDKLDQSGEVATLALMIMGRELDY